MNKSPKIKAIICISKLVSRYTFIKKYFIFDVQYKTNVIFTCNMKQHVEYISMTDWYHKK